MATFKAKGLVTKFRKKLIDRMTERGYKRDFAERVFKQLGDSEAMAFQKVMPPALLCWSMFHPGLNVIIRVSSLRFYSIACQWFFANLHKLLLIPKSMAYRSDLYAINLSLWDNTMYENEGNYRG